MSDHRDSIAARFARQRDGATDSDYVRAMNERDAQRRRADFAEARLQVMALRVSEASSLVRHMWSLVNPTGPAGELRERVEAFLGDEQ